MTLYGYIFSDIGFMDENGYIHLTGRMKDMVIRGGENIYPTEVENFLHTHPDIADVQVMENKRRGNLILVEPNKYGIYRGTGGNT